VSEQLPEFPYVVAAIGVTVDEVPARIQRLLHALRPAVLQDPG